MYPALTNLVIYESYHLNRIGGRGGLRSSSIHPIDGDKSRMEVQFFHLPSVIIWGLALDEALSYIIIYACSFTVEKRGKQWGTLVRLNEEGAKVKAWRAENYLAMPSNTDKPVRAVVLVEIDQ